jgi:hypothetical protein
LARTAVAMSLSIPLIVTFKVSARARGAMPSAISAASAHAHGAHDARERKLG